MKSWDILKDLGFTDDQLNSFFKTQQTFKTKLQKVEQIKSDLGITTYQKPFTPSTLKTYIKETYGDQQINTGKVLKEITEKMQKEANVSETNIPTELYEKVREFLSTLGTFEPLSFTQEDIEKIIEKYKDNLNFLNDEIDDILNILMRYVEGIQTSVDEETGEIIYMDKHMQYYPELNNAIQRANALIYG